MSPANRFSPASPGRKMCPLWPRAYLVLIRGKAQVVAIWAVRGLRY